MKLKMSLDEWYRELVRLLTQDGFTPPAKLEAKKDYDEGMSPQESAQHQGLSQTQWDEQEGTDPFIR